MKKAKRTKFGFFKNEKEALAYLKWRKKHFSERVGYSYVYYVKKWERAKSDKRNWLAYSLRRKHTLLLKGR